MDPFLSEFLIKKAGLLQEKSEPLSEEHARLRGSAEPSQAKTKRLTFLIDKTHRANQNLRLALIVSTVLAIACVALFTHSASLSSRNKALSAKNVRFRKEQRVVAERMHKERVELRNALEASKKDNENLRYELEKAILSAADAREEKTYLEDILIHKTKEIEKLKSAGSTGALKERDEDIARLQDQNRLLAAKLDKLYKTMLDRISAIGLAKSTLEETVADTKRRVDEEWNAVDLGSISVDRDGRAAAPASVAQAPAVDPKRAARKEGRVRAVNEAHGFVVVDLGKVDNLNEDSVLQIKKSGEWLATLTVLEVRDVMTACNVKNAVPGYRIRIDDPVFIQQR